MCSLSRNDPSRLFHPYRRAAGDEHLAAQVPVPLFFGLQCVVGGFGDAFAIGRTEHAMEDLAAAISVRRAVEAAQAALPQGALADLNPCLSCHRGPRRRHMCLLNIAPAICGFRLTLRRCELLNKRLCSLAGNHLFRAIIL